MAVVPTMPILGPLVKPVCEGDSGPEAHAVAERAYPTLRKSALGAGVEAVPQEDAQGILKKALGATASEDGLAMAHVASMAALATNRCTFERDERGQRQREAQEDERSLVSADSQSARGRGQYQREIQEKECGLQRHNRRSQHQQSGQTWPDGSSSRLRPANCEDLANGDQRSDDFSRLSEHNRGQMGYS